MKWKMGIGLCIIGLICACHGSDEEVVKEEEGPPAVAKTNDMKVYMHYMPWFQTKPFSGYWGSHWKMNTKNPDIADANGKREIASHYYPLIGPYDSRDKDVIEYHLLLMKYSGIDGLLIDWYGTHSVYDYKINLLNSNALIDYLDDVGLTFSVVYEEYTAENVASQTSKTAIEAAQADLSYLQSEYFSKGEYITIDRKPLLLTFGPRYFTEESQWNQILSQVNPKPAFIPLWHHTSRVGKNGGGEYSWVDFTPSLSDLSSFYAKTSVPFLMGSAYPRFHDFYAEGGWGSSYGHVDFNNGETLSKTLTKAQANNIQHLQLVTWNDFGEGTVIEPTFEDGFTCLKIIQEFTGVSYTEAELELIHQYYLKKVKYRNDPAALETLAEAFRLLCELKVSEARTLIEQFP